MTGDDIARLLYLVLLGGAILLWFVAESRSSPGKLARQALAWALIFVGVIAAIGLWQDIRRSVRPGAAVVRDTGQIEISRGIDGHYGLVADVNGVPIRFVVDTGASQIVLSREDARRAGIDVEALAYIGRARTANGEVRTAPVRLERLAIGPIVDEDVAAVVNEGDLDQSLLGMSYLQRFSSIEITAGKLVLTR